MKHNTRAIRSFICSLGATCTIDKQNSRAAVFFCHIVTWTAIQLDINGLTKISTDIPVSTPLHDLKQKVLQCAAAMEKFLTNGLKELSNGESHNTTELSDKSRHLPEATVFSWPDGICRTWRQGSQNCRNIYLLKTDPTRYKKLKGLEVRENTMVFEQDGGPNVVSFDHMNLVIRSDDEANSASEDPKKKIDESDSKMVWHSRIKSTNGRLNVSYSSTQQTGLHITKVNATLWIVSISKMDNLLIVIRKNLQTIFQSTSLTVTGKANESQIDIKHGMKKEEYHCVYSKELTL